MRAFDTTADVGRAFEQEYKTLLSARFSKGLRASTVTESRGGFRLPAMGHPDYQGLALHESAPATMAFAFIDMSGSTAESFWLDLDTVVAKVRAVLTVVARVVCDWGGYPLGLRGDGLLAGWGGRTSEPDIDLACAVAGAGFALDAVRNAVNESLAALGEEPVRMKVGLDYGETQVVRMGDERSSELNVIGHPANFAAYCEKKANSWEMVAGEGAADRLSEDLLTRHPDSPKEYQHKGLRRTYSYYEVAWDRSDLLGLYAGVPGYLGGRDIKRFSTEMAVAR